MDLPADLVAPDYEGWCISGIAGSVRRTFGIPSARALPEGALPTGAFDCVVLLILDALGESQVDAHRGNAPALGRVLSRASAATLTSVLPSTTTAALTTLLTGLTPVEHGMLGHSVFLRRFGLLADLLRFHPAYLSGHGGLVELGPPRELFPVRTLFEDLAEAGVQCRALMRRQFIGTPLSQIHLAGATPVPFLEASDFCLALRRVVAQTPRPLFVSAYWDAIDSLAHTYGPGSPEEAVELESFFGLFEREFLERLSPESRRGTLVLITADHGQAAANDEDALRLDDHPEIADALLMPPAGDRRATYLYARPGARGRLRRALAPFPGRFHVLESEDALRGGLFGTGIPAPEARSRMGDLVLLARGGATFVGHEKERPTSPLRGRHGGASPAEMRVPLLALTL